MFLKNGTFAVPNPGSVRYTGTPSREVDEAWEDLTRGTCYVPTTKLHLWTLLTARYICIGRYFRITKEEAIEAFGEARDEYWNDAVGGYMAGYVWRCHLD